MNSRVSGQCLYTIKKVFICIVSFNNICIYKIHVDNELLIIERLFDFKLYF